MSLVVCFTHINSERAEREAAERAKQLEEESDEDVVIGKVT